MPRVSRVTVVHSGGIDDYLNDTGTGTGTGTESEVESNVALLSSRPSSAPSSHPSSSASPCMHGRLCCCLMVSNSLLSIALSLLLILGFLLGYILIDDKAVDRPIHTDIETNIHPDPHNVSPPSVAELTRPHSSMYQQAVISYASGKNYDFAHVYPMVASFRVHHPYTQLIVFVTGLTLTDSDRQWYSCFRAQLIDIDPITQYYAHVQPMVMRVLIAADYLEKKWPFNDTNMLEESRRNAYDRSHCPFADWYAHIDQNYSEIADSLRAPLTHVFLADARDVLYQGNIFRFLPYNGRYHPEVQVNRATPASINSGLFLFSESKPLGEEGANRAWLNCLEPGMGDRDLSNHIINGGMILASHAAAIRYLRYMEKFIVQFISCDNWSGIDQGILNYLVHKKLLYNISVYVIPYATGPVASIAVEDKPLRQTPFGAILNAENQIYAVIHQYDRWWTYMVPMVNKMWRVLPPQELLIPR